MKQNHFPREKRKTFAVDIFTKKRNKGKIECVFSHFKLFNTMPTHLFLNIIYMHIRTETDKLPLVTRLKQIIQPLLAFRHMQWVVLQAAIYKTFQSTCLFQQLSSPPSSMDVRMHELWGVYVCECKTVKYSPRSNP